MKIKKNITIVIFAIAILLMLTGLILSIFYREEVDDNKKNNQDKSSTSESLMYNDEYMKYHTDIENMLSLVDSNMFSYYPISNFQKISSKKKTEFLIKIAFSGQPITRSNLEEEKNKYFSSNAKLVYESFNVGDYVFTYNQENEEYTKALRGYPDYTIESKIVEEQVTKKNWIVKKAIYFLEATSLPDVFPQKVYATQKDAKEDKNPIYTINNAEELLSIEENYNKIKNQLQVYKYTLKKDNELYKIQSIEKE